MSLNRSDLKTWLINLPQDYVRRTLMESQLQRLGLDYTLFAAIDGKRVYGQFADRVDESAYRKNMGMPLLPGKLGVYASHFAIWKDLCESSFELGLIFEDDVVFHDDFIDSLDSALNVSSHWDLVRFCCIRAKLPICQGRVGDYRLNAYVGPFTGNAAYLIKKKAAVRLLPSMWPQTRAMDHELNRFDVHNYRLRGLEPFSCHPDDGGLSTITGERFSLVKKPKWYKRLPHYQLKAGNYLRRTSWLLRHGSIPGSRAYLE